MQRVGAAAGQRGCSLSNEDAPFFIALTRERGEVAAPMALHGAKGEILFQKRISPFGTPKRTAGAFRSRPCTPNDQKGGASPLLFGLSSPRF